MIEAVRPGASFFFSFFLAALQPMEFLGQGSDQGHGCNLCHSCGKVVSFNLLAWAGD